jgi:hypothetical protein
MNKRKVLILLIIFTIIVGFAIASVSSVSAASKTVKFKTGDFKNYKLGKGDYVGAMYSLKGSQYPSRSVVIQVWSSNYYPKYYKMTKAKVYFKKSNGETVTRTYKGQYIMKKVPKGWKPIKAVVYYKRK